MRILVTGGTGHLGRAVVSNLKRDGNDVRVLSRQPSADPDVERVIGDLATGEGVREAIAGVEAIVHSATNSPAARRGRFKLVDFLRSPTDVDVMGTGRLLDAADEEGVRHFVYVSIVGLEHLRLLPYSRRKLEAEQSVKASRVPWSIVRATGFYWLLERMFESMTKQPILVLPGDARMAPVDSDEFARFVAECVADGLLGEREDFAGPETLSMIALTEQYMRARGVPRRIHRARLPARIQAAITAGNTSPTARTGTTTWEQWLKRSENEQHGQHKLKAAPT